MTADTFGERVAVEEVVDDTENTVMVDNPITVDIKGTLTVDAYGDIVVTAPITALTDPINSLTMVGDTQTGMVYVTVKNGSLNLSNTEHSYEQEAQKVDGIEVKQGDLVAWIKEQPITGTLTINANGNLYLRTENSDAERTDGAGDAVAKDDIVIHAGGDIHADDIHSTAGNAEVKAVGGDMLVDTIVAYGNTTVTADNVTATTIKAESGNASITATKDVDAGTISAGTNTTVTADNVTATTIKAESGNASITATKDVDAGTISAGTDAAVKAGGNVDAGTISAGADLEVDAEGNATVTTITAGTNALMQIVGDVNVQTVNAGETATVLSANGSVTAGTVKATQDTATVRSESGDVTVTTISAGTLATAVAGNDVKATSIIGGTDATVGAGKSITASTITAGDTASLKAENINELNRSRDAFVQADNLMVIVASDLGTANKPFVVDTNVLDVTADSANIREVSGDLILDNVDVKGDLNLVVPGSITDNNENVWDKVAQTKAELDAAEDAVAAAQATVKALTDKGTLTAAEKTKLSEANAKLTAAINTRDAKKSAYDAALAKAQGTDSTVNAGGNVTLTAGGSIGQVANGTTAGHGVSIDAAGTVNAFAGQNAALNTANVNLTSGKAITANVQAGKKNQGSTAITAAGSINNPAGGSIGGTKVALTSTSGDIGSTTQPIILNADEISISGGQVVAQNGKDVTVNNIHAAGDVSLTVKGNVTGGSGNVIAGQDISINAAGDIGKSGQALGLNAENGGSVSLTGQDINIDNKSSKLVVDEIKGDTVKINAAGDITGTGNKTNINARNVDTSSQGSTGNLTIEATGTCTQQSVYGKINGKVDMLKPVQTDNGTGANAGTSSALPKAEVKGVVSPIVVPKESVKAAAQIPPTQLLLAQVKGAKKQATLSWNKIDGATSYVIYMALGKNGKLEAVATVSGNDVSTVIKNLKKNKAYKFVVQAKFGNHIIGTSQTIYAAAGKFKGRTEAKKISAKSTITLKLGKKVKKSKRTIKAKVKARSGKLLNFAKTARYLVSDNSILKINSKGVITALRKGTCTVYVLTVNGLYKAVTVTIA